MEIDSKLRENTGRGDARRWRREGYIPAILYGGDDAPQGIALEARAIKIMMRDESFFSSVLTLKCGSKNVKALLREVQKHPSRADILHMDFQVVREGVEISASVPIHFVNTDIAPGVKLHQGIFTTVVNEVDIQCLPKDLPEAITINVEHLDVGGNVHLSDVEAPAGVRFTELSRGADPVLALISGAQAEEDDAAADEGDVASE